MPYTVPPPHGHPALPPGYPAAVYPGYPAGYPGYYPSYPGYPPGALNTFVRKIFLKLKNICSPRSSPSLPRPRVPPGRPAAHPCTRTWSWGLPLPTPWLGSSLRQVRTSHNVQLCHPLYDT